MTIQAFTLEKKHCFIQEAWSNQCTHSCRHCTNVAVTLPGVAERVLYFFASNFFVNSLSLLPRDLSYTARSVLALHYCYFFRFNFLYTNPPCSIFIHVRQALSSKPSTPEKGVVTSLLMSRVLELTPENFE